MNPLPTQPQKSKTVVWIILVLLFLLIISGGFFFWRSFLLNDEVDNPKLENALANATNRATSAIIGTWKSDCLVPDVNSSWSEQHQFVINADGTAVHTRWSGSDHACTPEETLATTYTYTIPQTGQINLTDQDSGSTIYDIYQVSGSTLKFGHGFQSPYPTGYVATQGFSAAKRFHDLNNYIVYKK
ncbi:MAG: lipocalin family protein [Patescibacteria group bacterium]